VRTSQRLTAVANLTPTPRLGFTRPRLGVAAGALQCGGVPQLFSYRGGDPTPPLLLGGAPRNGSRLSRTDADASLPLGVAAGACDPVQGRRRSPGVYCGVRSIALSALLLAATVSGGCLVLALQPAYDSESVVFDEALLGSGRTRTTAPRLRLNGASGDPTRSPTRTDSRRGPFRATSQRSRGGLPRSHGDARRRPRSLSRAGPRRVRITASGDTLTASPARLRVVHARDDGEDAARPRGRRRRSPQHRHDRADERDPPLAGARAGRGVQRADDLCENTSQRGRRRSSS